MICNKAYNKDNSVEKKLRNTAQNCFILLLQCKHANAFR